MRIPVSRRGFIELASAASAALIALARGWVAVPHAGALTRWRLLAPITGQIGSCSFHCGACGGSTSNPCDNALDFMYRLGPNDTKVKLYILNDSGVSGYGGILSLETTCSSALNPDHKRMKYNVATSGFVLLGVGVISHIVPSVAVGALVSANGGQLGTMHPNTDQFKTGCYEGTHVHFGVLSGAGYPTTMTPIGSWSNVNVTAGFNAPWEKYI